MQVLLALCFPMYFLIVWPWLSVMVLMAVMSMSLSWVVVPWKDLKPSLASRGFCDMVRVNDGRLVLLLQGVTWVISSPFVI